MSTVTVVEELDRSDVTLKKLPLLLERSGSLRTCSLFYCDSLRTWETTVSNALESSAAVGA
jgi:hypothetical protein